MRKNVRSYLSFALTFFCLHMVLPYPITACQVVAHAWVKPSSLQPRAWGRFFCVSFLLLEWMFAWKLESLKAKSDFWLKAADRAFQARGYEFWSPLGPYINLLDFCSNYGQIATWDLNPNIRLTILHSITKSYKVATIANSFSDRWLAFAFITKFRLLLHN